MSDTFCVIYVRFCHAVNMLNVVLTDDLSLEIGTWLTLVLPNPNLVLPSVISTSKLTLSGQAKGSKKAV